MGEYSIRGCRGAEDAARQYALWLDATDGLPRAWRSCLRNVEHQVQQAARFPNSRLYAEGTDGRLLGYIGTHPPFEWNAADHGPPAEAYGWVIPFGFPWTHARDAALEAALYDEMTRLVPEVYAEFRRDVYIQRFRESWAYHVEFVERRGWKLRERLPLLGRRVAGAGEVPAGLVAVSRDDLGLVSELSQVDEVGGDRFTRDDLERRHDAGWLVGDTFWRLEDHGAFAIEQRGAWAGVTLFAARPGAWDDTLQAAAAQAKALSAEELYFTIDAGDKKREAALLNRGFQEVDAGVYYVREAD